MLPVTRNCKHCHAAAKLAACTNSITASILLNFYILGALVTMMFYWSRQNLVWDSTHMVYAVTLNLIWMWSFCWLLVAKNLNFGQILTFGGLLYRRRFSDECQMWFARADPLSTLTHQISSWSVYFVTLWWRKTLNFTILLTSAFCGVTSWRQSEKVEHGCTTTNPSLSNHMKIVSVLQRLHGKIMHTNSDVQKRDGQRNRQKLQCFLPPGIE